LCQQYVNHKVAVSFIGGLTGLNHLHVSRKVWRYQKG